MPEPLAAEARRAVVDSGRPLDAPLRETLAPWYRRSLDKVRVHVGSPAQAAAQRLRAHAFTLGHDIAFGGGRWAPEQPAGLRLLAHELAHVDQQAAASAGPTLVQRAGFGEVKEVDSQDNELQASAIEELQDRMAVWFEFDSTELRHDATVDSTAGFATVQADVLRHGAEAGDKQRVTVHGYASEEGDPGHNLGLSGDRAIRVKKLLVDAGVPSERVIVEAHGADESLPEISLNRRVEIELQPHVTLIDQMPGQSSIAVSCHCKPGAQGPIADWAIAYVTEIAPTIEQVAQQRGIPPLALAGSIAEEYETRRGFHAFVDWYQDTVLPLAPEIGINIERIPDFHNKLMNLLEHDIGRANIHVRTALEQVEAGRLTVPGSPPTDAQVNLIVDYLVDEHGMVDAAGSVLQQGQELFGPYIGDYDAGYQDAVLIDFFNIGYDIYYVQQFQPQLAKDPHHRPCPDDVGDGCQVLESRDAIEAAYEAGLSP